MTARTTSFTYTAKGLVDVETAANGNTVDYDYYLDGLVRHQVEVKPDGTNTVVLLSRLWRRVTLAIT